LKKHDDDPDARIARIRGEIVAKHEAIAALRADMHDQQQQLLQLERELDDAYKAREMVLLEREKAFVLATQRITSTVTINKIRLDVGGRYFSVTLDMLLKYPDSFFARLFFWSMGGPDWVRWSVLYQSKWDVISSHR
jgi:hypothetical protein